MFIVKIFLYTSFMIQSSLFIFWKLLLFSSKIQILDPPWLINALTSLTSQSQSQLFFYNGEIITSLFTLSFLLLYSFFPTIHILKSPVNWSHVWALRSIWLERNNLLIFHLFYTCIINFSCNHPSQKLIFSIVSWEGDLVISISSKQHF